MQAISMKMSKPQASYSEPEKKSGPTLTTNITYVCISNVPMCNDVFLLFLKYITLK